MATIDVFVYGTLRPGGRYHDRFCRGALAVRPALVAGTVEWLPAGYPRMTMRAADVLARGSADALADARTQDAWRRRVLATDPPVAPLVSGDVLGFDDPEVRLAALDELEDFRVEGGGLYERVLVPARVVEASVERVLPVWTYAVIG